MAMRIKALLLKDSSSIAAVALLLANCRLPVLSGAVLPPKPRSCGKRRTTPARVPRHQGPSWRKPLLRQHNRDGRRLLRGDY